MPFPKSNAPRLSRLYHVNSSLNASKPFYITETAERAVNGSFFDFEGRPRFRPDGAVPPPGSLDDLFDRRSSTRPFSGSISADALWNALRRATRINRARINNGILGSKRVYPSAGGLYSVEVYVAALDVGGLNRSIYHWNVLEEVLEELWPVENFSMVGGLPGIQPLTDVPGATVLLTSYFPRLEWKYGDRSYRFALMEAAAVAQNLQLVATDMDISSRWVGGFRDDFWNEALRIDADQEMTLLAVAIG